MTLACNEPDVSETVPLAQGVKGIVTLKSGYNGERVDNQTNPPEPASRPLHGATVYLILRQSDGGGPTFVDSTITDSAGHYVLPASPGLYYVGVATEKIAAPIMVSLPGDSTQLVRRIHALVGLNVVAGRFIQQPIDIREMSLK